MRQPTDFCQLGRSIMSAEIEAIQTLPERLTETFSTACQYLLACEGRIVVTGMGKSGHIGHKIASTLASTGSPAFFLHPAEACHGDLGMLKGNDVVLAISNSGNTKEILSILALIEDLEIPLLTMTGDPKSRLALKSSANLDVSVDQEACPLGLAPTSSTTATLLMGDALALTLLECRGFTKEDFARSHPGGSLGRRLLLRVNDVMHREDETPMIYYNASLSDALIEMSRMNLGIIGVVDAEQKLMGVFTDGDLRRCLDVKLDIHSTPISEVMTRSFKAIKADVLAIQALEIMQTNKINALLVVDDEKNTLGAVNMHDLLLAEII